MAAQSIELNPIAIAQMTKIENDFGIDVLTNAMVRAGNEAAVVLEEGISPYPETTGNELPLFYVRTRKDGTTYRSKFKNKKQQAKVMQLARDGKIPYKRTGTLGKSITTQVKKAGRGKVRISIGSDRDYAPYVIGDDQEQSHYHRGNWTPIVEDVDAALPDAIRAFEQSIGRQLATLQSTDSSAG